jgi:hypothetical protein
MSEPTMMVCLSWFELGLKFDLALCLLVIKGYDDVLLSSFYLRGGLAWKVFGT